jgi:acyl-CoA thioesterase
MQGSDIHTILSTLKNSADNTTSFTDAWSQGRAAFGGLAAAFGSCGIAKLMETPQPLRSMMVSFVAPLPAGDISVAPVIVRQGKNVTQASADVISEGDICLQMMAVFGNPREALRVPSDEVIQPPPKSEGISFAEHQEGTPPFLQYFDGFWLGGGMPFSGKPDRKLNMWVRHRSDLTDFPAEKIITIADIPPPVILSHFDRPPVPVSSLTWSLEFIKPPESIKSDWFYLDFQVDAAAEGYTQQSGRVFDEQGVLCALSRQCMVYFG